MCGLVTLWSVDGKPVGLHTLARMTERLAHRGPDDFGYAWADTKGTCRTWTTSPPFREPVDGILFGHRRLSILDLSSAGHQPLIRDRGNLILSYNGEVYNFVELRSELESAGVEFVGLSDTEVVLEAYRKWGNAAFEKFNGMWALTIWDQRRQALIASRDRFGIKPLYYARVNGVWLFASEIKALLEYPELDRQIDEANTYEFIARGRIDHTTDTLIKGIYSVPPGSCLTVRGDQASTRYFWRLERQRCGGSREEMVERFRSVLSDSVRLRMRSDVAIGTMLSGGLDSTSITVIIDQYRQTPDQLTSTAETTAIRDFHHTFSACWPEAKALDEERAVKELCSALGLSSDRLYPTAEEVLETLPDVTRALDLPFETPICTVQYLLMRRAKRHGVKVVLNGHGSDEQLAGYPEYSVPALLVQLLLELKFGSFWSEFRAFGQWSKSRLMVELVRGLVPVRLRPRLHDSFRRIRERREAIFSEPYPETPSRHHALTLQTVRGLPHFEGVLWLMFAERIMPQWLRMEDRMSMAHSVESRLPFLDYRLVELVFGLPHQMKLSSGYTKYVLRQAMAPLLPGGIARQRTKLRFAAPFPSWFRTAWRPLIEDLLMNGSCRVRRYLKHEEFCRRLGRYLDGDDHALSSSVLWRILNTELWLGNMASSGTAGSVGGTGGR